MTVEIKPNGNLLVTIDAKDRARMKRWKPGLLLQNENRVMTWIITTAQFGIERCNPADVGALTSAPMLCETGGEPRAWGFMDYQIVMLQEQLLDKGQAIFTKG